MIEPIAWLILLPLAWATLAFLAGPGRGARLAIVGVLLQLMLALQLAIEVSGGARQHLVGGWDAPLGILLLADGLSGTLLLLTQVVALPLCLYARAYFAQHPQGVRYFWPLTGFLLAGMHALFLSADVFNLYVTLELVGLAAVGLVASHGEAGQIAAALRYLLTTLLGSGAYLCGVVLLYAAYGNVSLSVLAPLIAQHAQEAPQAVWLAGALMLLGLLLKTALFPFHGWLPPAHGGAPAPVSALLSALVIKATFYLIVRLWLTLFAPLAPAQLATLLGALGAAAILWGSLMALRQRRLKMLVAYSTVAQIGYLFLLFPLLFPLVPPGSPGAAQSAYQGAFLQVLAHALAKAAMFAAVGAILLATGRDELVRLGGLSSRLPLTLLTFALAGVTLMGLPPTLGFLAKWLTLDAAIRGRQWVWVGVLILGGLLTAAYVFKVLRHAFREREPGAQVRPLARMLEWPPLVLAVGSLLLGLRGAELLALLGTP